MDGFLCFGFPYEAIFFVAEVLIVFFVDDKCGICKLHFAEIDYNQRRDGFVHCKLRRVGVKY
jgi:hypothetical protein